MKRSWTALILVIATPVAAQQSASFRADDHVVNAGGSPAAGAVPASAGFRVTLASIGEPLGRRSLSSASFRSDAGFATAYPPPREVTGLRFASKTSLSWDAERSAGTYNLYRDAIASLPGLGFGTCLQPGLTSAGATDADPVPVGGGYFYLATAVNRLHEEGTKGFRSNGAERQGAACP